MLLLLPLRALPVRPLALALGRGRGAVSWAVSTLGPVLPRLQLETQPAVLLLLDGGLQQQRVEAGAHRLADFLDGELDDLLQHGLELALEERDVHGAVHGVGGRAMGRSLILLRPERDGGRLAGSLLASVIRRLLGLSSHRLLLALPRPGIACSAVSLACAHYR